MKIYGPVFAATLFILLSFPSAAAAVPSKTSDAFYTEERIKSTLHRIAGDDLVAFFGYVPDINTIPDPSPNAYVLPPHTVVLTTGLLSVIESEDELAFVLAHEIGHLHSSQQADNLELHGPEQLFRHEIAADRYAMTLLEESGMDAGHGALLLQRIQRIGNRGGSTLSEAFPSLAVRLRWLSRNVNH